MNTQSYFKRFWALGALGLMLGAPLLVLAAEFRTGDQPSIGSGETINDDVYIAGGSVTSAGTINGDLFAAGGNIVVSGNVRGDATLGGGSITITSEIADDVRVGGGTVVLQSAVGGDVLVGGGQVHISGRQVGGDVVVGGGMVRIEAPVSGDVRIGGGDIFINAPVAGNIKIEGGTLTIGSAARITGSVNYRGDHEMVREQGSEIRGEVRFEERKDKKAAAALISVWKIGKFLSLLVSALFFGLLFRRYATEITTRLAADPVRETGRGLLIIVLIPILSIAFLVTLVGIPFGIIGLLSFVIMIIFMCILAPIVLGSILAHKIRKHSHYHVTWKTIILGVVVYTILDIIPVIGTLAQILLVLAVLGTALKFKWGIAREWR